MRYYLYGMGIVGIALSFIAAIYSISGLTVIFKGAYIATILMASAMELAKVSISIYLHIYWKTANKLLSAYLIFALVVLMVITSIGIYGYLSKSYLTSTDTTVSSERVNNLETLVNIKREKIRINSEVINSMQKTPVEDRPNWHNSRVYALTKEIETASKSIEKYNQELMPEKSKITLMSLEVGPLKYVALLLYGSDGKEAIDKAVQILIIMLVCVFDPLAILLILASIHALELVKDHKVEESYFDITEETHIVPETKKEVAIKKEIPSKPSEETKIIQELDELEKKRFADIGNFKNIGEIYQKFPWLKKASISSAKVSYDEGGRLHWHDGVFHSGIWRDGVWHKGTFKSAGTWISGDWKNGSWESEHKREGS